MGKQQVSQEAVSFTSLPEIGKRWGQFPTEERRAELDARLRSWDESAGDGSLRGPFDYQGWPYILTGSDVHYLAAKSLATPHRSLSMAVEHLQSRIPFPLFDLHLEGAFLYGASLEGARLYCAHLDSAMLRYANMQDANLSGACLDGADLTEAHIDGAVALEASLKDIHASGCTLNYANLVNARFENANLTDASLIGAKLWFTHFEGTNLSNVQLQGANLREAFFDAGTCLSEAIVGDSAYGAMQVVDVRWQSVNLAVVHWPKDIKLGDEQYAQKLSKETCGQAVSSLLHRALTSKYALDEVREEVLAAWHCAARANRQIASAMRSQGMNDDADRFSYHAQLCQRRIYRYQRRYLSWSFSVFLDALAGYGFKPGRSVAWYIATVLGFGVLYLCFAHLPLLEAIVLSITSFHGRGFPGSLSLRDPIMIVASCEAIFGLLIEVSFIATFTQRFFSR